MIDYCERVRPDVLPYTVADPSYHISIVHDHKLYAPYIDAYLDTIDPAQMCFDYYPIGKDEYDPKLQLDNSTMWADLEIVRRAAQKRDIPFWFYYQGYTLYRCTEEEDFVFPMVRCFMYAAAMYGAKGLQQYTASTANKLSVVDAAGNKAKFFYDQKAIHAEFKAIGNTLMALDSKLVYHSEDLLPGDKFLPLYVETIADSNIIGGKLPNRTSVGELEDQYGNRYVIILNRDYEKELDTVLTLKGDYRIYEVSRVDGYQDMIIDSTRELPIKLAPGDAVLLRVQPSSEEAFTCEYKLAE